MNREEDGTEMMAPPAAPIPTPAIAPLDSDLEEDNEDEEDEESPPPLLLPPLDPEELVSVAPAAIGVDVVPFLVEEEEPIVAAPLPVVVVAVARPAVVVIE